MTFVSIYDDISQRVVQLVTPIVWKDEGFPINDLYRRVRPSGYIVLAATKTAIAFAFGVCGCDEEKWQALNESGKVVWDGVMEHGIEVANIPEAFDTKTLLSLFFAFMQ